MICTPFCSLCRKAKLSRISSRLNVSRKFLKSVSIRTNFTWNDSLEKYVENLVTEYDRIDKKLLNSQALSPTQVKRYSREIHRLKPAVQSYDDLKRKQNEMMEMIELGEVDVDMKNLVDEEVELYQCRISELQSKLIDLVIPKDEEDTSNAILELRAGAGGREAAIFASEMFNMYSKFCVLKNWKLEVLSQNESNEGGLSKACASIIGRNVFGTLKHEIGVHRVQRVPLTESLGRLHTSTVAVAVLPQPTDINVVLDMRDVKVDTFKSSGAGGQHVNTTDSAVRLTHIPTGIVVASQEERSQIKNKSNAIRILTAQLYDLERNRADKEMHEARRSQIGTADRSERVRTYNFPQDRVTDHRIGVSFHGINEFLVGGSPLMDLIEKLQLHEKMKSLSRISGENLINAASNN